jgi:hypothetical protein
VHISQEYFRARLHSTVNVAVLGSKEPHQVLTLSEGHFSISMIYAQLTFLKSDVSQFLMRWGYACIVYVLENDI